MVMRMNDTPQVQLFQTSLTCVGYALLLQAGILRRDRTLTVESHLLISWSGANRDLRYIRRADTIGNDDPWSRERAIGELQRIQTSESPAEVRPPEHWERIDLRPITDWRDFLWELRLHGMEDETMKRIQAETESVEIQEYMEWCIAVVPLDRLTH